MKLGFSVSVSATKIWRFPPLGFCFLRDLQASSPGQCLGLFNCLDALPFVCRRGPPHMEISQPKFMRRPKLGVTGAATFRDFRKAKRRYLPNSRRNRVAMNAVALEVVIGHRQPAVIIATVIGALDLDAVENAPC